MLFNQSEAYSLQCEVCINALTYADNNVKEIHLLIELKAKGNLILQKT